MKIPPLVLVACGAMIAGVAVQALHVLVIAPENHADGWQMLSIMGVLTLGVLIGIVRGSRFAWQSGRMLNMVAGTLLCVYGVMAIVTQRLGEDSVQTGIWMIASGVCFAVASLVLHMRAVRGHVDLICPQCQTVTSRPANISFSQARCRNPQCNHRW